jgi:hypothetical protein
LKSLMKLYNLCRKLKRNWNNIFRVNDRFSLVSISFPTTNFFKSYQKLAVYRWCSNTLANVSKPWWSYTWWMEKVYLRQIWSRVCSVLKSSVWCSRQWCRRRTVFKFGSVICRRKCTILWEGSLAWVSMSGWMENTRKKLTGSWHSRVRSSLLPPKSFGLW